jgi:hypothetical protein
MINAWLPYLTGGFENVKVLSIAERIQDTCFKTRYFEIKPSK